MTMAITLLFVLIGLPLLIAGFIFSYEFIEKTVKLFESHKKESQKELHITG